MSSAREALLKTIIDAEQAMFCALNTGEDQCTEEKIKPFRMGRWMSFSVLSDDFLASYRKDLDDARVFGRNLLMEKYALISGQIDMPADMSLIVEIVAQECDWMEALSEKYPHVIQHDAEKAAGFKRYAICELATYSKNTIGLLHRDVSKAVEEGVNLAEKRYENFYHRIGRGSLEDMETAAAA